MHSHSSVKRSPALLLSGFALLLAHGLAESQANPQADAPAPEEQPQVVTITGNYFSDLRAYTHYAPGVAIFREYRHLAPDAQLRFSLTSRTGVSKPLPLAKASLEARNWSVDLPIVDDGWFVLPDSEEAFRRKASVKISRRIGGADVGWVIDVHTPGLPAQTYRLGDLRLECMVYLAIEWQASGGTRLMGQPRSSPGGSWLGSALRGAFGQQGADGKRTTDRRRDASSPPMEDTCNGPQSIWMNSRPWPRLQAYVLSDGERKLRVELDKGHDLKKSHLMLELNPAGTAPPWPNDTLVKFEFFDGSHWGQASAAGKQE